jgi:hypothetical protein
VTNQSDLLAFALHGLVQRWLTLSQACDITGSNPRELGEALGGHYKQMEDHAA